MNDQQVMIRSLSEFDICDLNLIRTTKGVFEYLLSVQTETLTETENYFLSEKERKHTFVAEKNVDGRTKVVGYIRLIQDKDIRKKHKARISIAISAEHQQEGIGRMLFEYIIDFSKNWLMLRKLELTVLANNELAVKLYQKQGFMIEGHLVQDTVVDGTYEDVYYMSLFL